MSCRCDVFGAWDESDHHALFECRLAREIWKGSPFSDYEGASRPSTRVSELEMFGATKEALGDRWGEFVIAAWSCWNARNNWLFRQPIANPQRLVKKAMELTQEYRDTMA